MNVIGKYDPDFLPGEWAMYPDSDCAAERKSPPLSTVYPEVQNYLRLDPRRYYDKEFAAKEWAAIWSKTWICAGRESDAKKTGQWFRFDLGHESFVIMRGDDGVLRALANVCQHRGRRLVTADFGLNGRLVCGFHSWCYDSKGENIRVTDRQFFQKEALSGNLDLPAIRCEIWGGFVFINLDPDAALLRDFLDELPGIFEAYRLEDMHIVKEVEVSVNCNWKVANEAFLEPYHTHITHPQIMSMVDEVHAQYDYYKNGHSRVINALSIPSPRQDDRETLSPGHLFALECAGVDPSTFKGTARDIRAALQASKRQPDNSFGLDYARYSDGQLVDNWNPGIFPNICINALPESVQFMRFLPDAGDPSKCRMNVMTLMPKTRDGVRPSPFFGVGADDDVSGNTRPPRIYTTQAAPGIGDVLEQDVSNMPEVQAGLESGRLKGGVRLSEQEQRVQQFHAEIDRLFRRANLDVLPAPEA